MVNTRQKGNRAEKEYKAILESQGYLVIKAPMANMYQDEADIVS